MTDPLKFLRAIWKFQPDGHFFLAYFDETHTFRERSFPRSNGVFTRPPRLSRVGNGVDLYFCPNSFSEINRRNSYGQEGRWLYADLDESDPLKLPRSIRPTIAWQTSPNRYQAAWLLDTALPADKLAITNQWLTYESHADKGGWSLTKVLRVPGSVSHKRDTPFNVELLWVDGPRHSADALYKRARASRRDPSLPQSAAEERSVTQLRKKYWKVMPAGARKILRATPEQAARSDRSATLWKLENMLLEAGLHPAEVFTLAKASAYNKFKGEQREEAQLWAEVMRAAARHDLDLPLTAKAKKVRQRAEQEVEKTTRVTVIEEAQARAAEREKAGEFPGILGVELKDFLAKPYPKPSWLVQDIWTTGSYGVISGAWKGYKSMLSLDLALSISTGDEFLGHFAIGGDSSDPNYEPEPQPVLYLHEEGAPGLIADRLGRIAHSKGFWGARVTNGSNGLRFLVNDRRIPLFVSTFPGLDLTQEEWLEVLYDSIIVNQYKMVILESLYLITGDADENEAAALKPTLQGIAEVSRETKSAIAISHHYNKSADAGQRKLARLSGTGVVARWLESGLFLERVGEESDNSTKLDVIHRELPSMTTKILKFNWDEDDEGDYNVDVMDARDMVEVPAESGYNHRGNRKSNQLHILLAEAGEDGVSIGDLAEELDVQISSLRTRIRKQGLRYEGGRVFES